MDKKYWTRFEVIQLIKRYEQHEELWNIKSVNFKNRYKKHAALFNLSKTFKCTPAEISRKIHNLRTQFNQECKKIENNHLNSKWEYFKDLAFIKYPYAISDEDIKTKNQNNELDFTRYSALFMESDIEHDYVNTVGRYRIEDEYQVFGDYVASELRSLRSNFYRRKLKRAIQKCILDVLEKDDKEELLAEKDEVEESEDSSMLNYVVEDADYEIITTNESFYEEDAAA